MIDAFEEIPVYLYPEPAFEGEKVEPFEVVALVDLSLIGLMYTSIEGITHFIMQGDTTATPLSIPELRKRIAEHKKKLIFSHN